MIINSVFLNALGKLQINSIKELPPTQTSLQVRDADGKFAPVLIIKTELKGLGIKNIGRPTKHAPIYEEDKNQYKFYTNDNQRVIEITHSEYEPLEVRLLADFNIDLDAQRIYEIILDNEPEKEFINVVIISNPSDTEKIIDGESKGTGQTFNLSIGKHNLKLQKPGYKPLIKEINVTKTNTLFNNLKLQEVELVMITIKSNPEETTIFINNVEEGKTNKQLFKFPDEYILKLMKSKYETIEKTIKVTEIGNNIFEYNLVKSTVNFTISVTPSDADIYLNNEKLTSNTKEVSSGRYKIEVSKDGYFSQTRTIDVIKGNDITEYFTLKQKTGKLQFTVEPMEANVTLKKDGETIDSWTGSKMKSSLPVGEYEITAALINDELNIYEGNIFDDMEKGEYEITASLNHYGSKTKKCTIELDKTMKVNIALENGKNLQGFENLGGLNNMVFVQGGTYQMGSNDGESDEKPVHEVYVDDFYIGKYEVTVAEFKEFIDTTSYKTDAEKKGKSWIYDESWKEKNGVTWKCDVKGNIRSKSDYNHPVIHVSWNDAKAYCEWKGRRLPTEAEWEFASHGGNESRGYKYSGSNSIYEVAWFSGNSGNKMHKVGIKKANELGIYDMTGNVWEWCNDWYSKKYYKDSMKENPQGPNRGKYRILRGGSWCSKDNRCLSTERNDDNPVNSYSHKGFRLARSVE